MTFVIAEAGSNHELEIEKAFRLIDAAKDAGADACKFQFWGNPGRLAAQRGEPSLERLFTINKLPREWLPKLYARCDKIGIEFMCTTYLIGDIQAVAPFVRKYKVSSFEAKDTQFIEAHGDTKPIIVSTGGLTTSQILDIPGRCITLHCVSEYPTSIDKANQIRVKMTNGLSDHTRSLLSGAVAVGTGAAFIEKHFMLADTNDRCPDYGVSLSPGQLRTYIDNIREAERLMGVPAAP